MNQSLTIKSVLLAGAAASCLSVSALAEDAPVKVPPNAVVTSSGGLYVWATGPWPSGQGPAPLTAPNTLSIDGGATAAAPESAAAIVAPTGEVLQGGIGYVFPDETFPPVLGSRVRAEIGGSSAHASVPQSPGGPNPLIGSGANGTILGGCAGCNVPVTSNYSRQGTSVKAASDYNVFGVTLSPSVSVFGAGSNQAIVPMGSGSGASTLEWNDWGAKAGLDTKVNIAPKMALDVGGNVGIARRSTTLTTSNAAGAATSTSAASNPVVANSEARLTYKPQTDFELQTFGGVNAYDSRVPGVAAPPAGSAPGIKFSPEAGYYAGAGLTYRFGTR